MSNYNRVIAVLVTMALVTSAPCDQTIVAEITMESVQAAQREARAAIPHTFVRRGTQTWSLSARRVGRVDANGVVTRDGDTNKVSSLTSLGTDGTGTLSLHPGYYLVSMSGGELYRNGERIFSQAQSGPGYGHPLHIGEFESVPPEAVSQVSASGGVQESQPTGTCGGGGGIVYCYLGIDGEKVAESYMGTMDIYPGLYYTATAFASFSCAWPTSPEGDGAGPERSFGHAWGSASVQGGASCSVAYSDQNVGSGSCTISAGPFPLPALPAPPIDAWIAF